MSNEVPTVTTATVPVLCYCLWSVSRFHAGDSKYITPCGSLAKTRTLSGLLSGKAQRHHQ